MTGRAADEDAPAGCADAALRQEIARLRAELTQVKAQLLKAESLADRDTLTPLYNRRAVIRELARARTYVERYGAPMSVIFFDLDGLKTLNDRFGHATGDAALCAVAEQLLAHVRASDTVGRIGGDEFAVILAQADGFQAEAKAAALAQAIAAQPIAGLGPGAQLSVSWGVAQIRAGQDAEAILAEADAAMYVAKRDRKRPQVRR